MDGQSNDSRSQDIVTQEPSIWETKLCALQYSCATEEGHAHSHMTPHALITESEDFDAEKKAFHSVEAPLILIWHPKDHTKRKYHLQHTATSYSGHHVHGFPKYSGNAAHDETTVLFDTSVGVEEVLKLGSEYESVKDSSVLNCDLTKDLKQSDLLAGTSGIFQTDTGRTIIQPYCVSEEGSVADGTGVWATPDRVALGITMEGYFVDPYTEHVVRRTEQHLRALINQQSKDGKSWKLGKRTCTLSDHV